MAHRLSHTSLNLGNLDAEFCGDHFVGLVLEPVQVEHCPRLCGH